MLLSTPISHIYLCDESKRVICTPNHPFGVLWTFIFTSSYATCFVIFDISHAHPCITKKTKVAFDTNINITNHFAKP